MLPVREQRRNASLVAVGYGRPLVGRPQLLVIRHGETEWSRAGRHTGRSDIPLNEQGREEARGAARTLDGWNITRGYTSPLGRARETAEIVAPPCGVVADPDLVEWDYGVYEGRTTFEIREEEPGGRCSPTR